MGTAGEATYNWYWPVGTWMEEGMRFIWLILQQPSSTSGLSTRIRRIICKENVVTDVIRRLTLCRIASRWPCRGF